MKLNDLFNVTSENFKPFYIIPNNHTCQVYTWIDEFNSRHSQYQSIFLVKENEYSGTNSGGIFTLDPNTLVRDISIEASKISSN